MNFIMGGSAFKHNQISSSDHGAEVDEYKNVREKNNSIEERDQGLHCQIINDIPRLGTGYLIITMHQNTIIQLDIYNTDCSSSSVQGHDIVNRVIVGLKNKH